MKILLVDYPRAERRATVEALAAIGHTDVVLADDGWAGLAALAKGDIEMILTELHLTVMTGLVFVDNVRRRSATVPILVVTGHTLESGLLSAIDAGANDTMTKPVSPEALREKIDRLRSGEPGAAALG